MFADFGGKSSFRGCGLRGSDTILRRRREDTDFIHGGTEVADKQHPWHAALTVNDEIICGGTLISKTAVLTGF